jgi:hypothetical protein
MQSTNDPIRSVWLQTVIITGVGAAAFALAAVWALAPYEREPVDLSWRPATPAPEPEPEGARVGEMAMFEKRLWTPPERPVEIATEPAPPAPPPPRLVLLGIVAEDKQGPAAILYDPDTNTTHIARPGATIGPVTLGSVTHETATLSSPDGDSVLRLDTGRPPQGQG